MRIGPKDPFSGVPQGPEETKQEPSQTEFPSEAAQTEATGPAQEAGDTSSASSVTSIYAGFKSRTELGGEFLRQTLDDFKGSIADSDLQRIGNLLQEQAEEDPLIQGKLDRILSLAK